MVSEWLLRRARYKERFRLQLSHLIGASVRPLLAHRWFRTGHFTPAGLPPTSGSSRRPKARVTCTSLCATPSPLGHFHYSVLPLARFGGIHPLPPLPPSLPRPSLRSGFALPSGLRESAIMKVVRALTFPPRPYGSAPLPPSGGSFSAAPVAFPSAVKTFAASSSSDITATLTLAEAYFEYLPFSS